MRSSPPSALAHWLPNKAARSFLQGDAKKLLIGGRRVDAVGGKNLTTTYPETGSALAAVVEANNTEFGLAAAVWTRDIGRAHRMTRRLQAGTVWISSYTNMDAAVPFGGHKQSELGRTERMRSRCLYSKVKSIHAGP